MKIAHFSFGDTVGAFGAAYDLHKYLRLSNIESTFFVRKKTRDDDSVVELSYENTVEERLLQVINAWYFNENKRDGGSAVSLHTLGISWDDEFEKKIREYDIFHIHWIPQLLSVENIHRIVQMNKPVLWTLHDFNPFTGGCHYPEECNGYGNNCAGCPLLINNENNISQYILQDKINSYGNRILTIVASNWLKGIVKKSRVFCDNKCVVIPIGIDINVFRILDKKEARKRFGFSEDKKIILFGAQSLDQNIKGYVYLDKLFKLICEDSYFSELISRDELEIISFGGESKRINYGSIPYKSMGYIQDREVLCNLYNVADIFVFPSIQETFGMAATEAMACGTPTVAFDVCAMHDVIDNGVNGFKVPLGDYEVMFQHIKEIMQNNIINSYTCRMKIVKKYSLEREAQDIIELYKECLVQDKAIVQNKEWNETAETKEFIQKCISEIRKDCALNQSMEYETICMEYNPLFISSEEKVNKLINEGCLNQKTPVYIYGAGIQGVKMLNLLVENNIMVMGFWDSDIQKWDSFVDNYRVMQPYKKERNKNYKIIIASMSYEAIVKKLLSLGYKKNDFY